MILCDKCPKAFCDRCIEKNLGKTKCKEITKAKIWACFGCEPSQLYEHKAIYYSIYLYKKSQVLEEEVTVSEISPTNERTKRTRSNPFDVTEPSDNFITENIEEALKTAMVYKKCLDKALEMKLEMDNKCKNSAQKMDRTSYVRMASSLHKIYQTCIENVDILDDIIVRSHEEQFSSSRHLSNQNVNVDSEEENRPTISKERKQEMGSDSKTKQSLEKETTRPDLLPIVLVKRVKIDDKVKGKRSKKNCDT